MINVCVYIQTPESVISNYYFNLPIITMHVTSFVPFFTFSARRSVCFLRDQNWDWKWSPASSSAFNGGKVWSKKGKQYSEHAGCKLQKIAQRSQKTLFHDMMRPSTELIALQVYLFALPCVLYTCTKIPKKFGIIKKIFFIVTFVFVTFLLQ